MNRRRFIYGSVLGWSAIVACAIGYFAEAFGITHWTFWASLNFAAFGLAGSSTYELLQASSEGDVP